MEYVEIPATVTLEAMMKGLCLPCPQYKTKAIAYGNYETEVQFYPSLQFLQTSLAPHSLLGYPEASLEAAVDNAARRAIRYMETVEKKVPKESQHHVLEKEKNKNSVLLRKLKSVGQKITKKSKQIRVIMDASDAYIDRVCMSTDRIQEIVSGSSSTPCNRRSDKYAATLLEFKAVATNLAQNSVEIIEKFRAARVYPYGGDETECDSSSECFDSDVDHRRSEAYDFDSAGERYSRDGSL